ncbi:MAG: LysR family transcriptional regulator [Candidatus Rokuibacteriota bacterium]
MRPKVKVWVVFGKRTKFGDGRAQLLALIDELGSIQKAVARVGMSYRTAWGYLRELEQAAGFKFLEPGPRGGRRSGTRLTRRGKRFLAQYWRFREGLDAIVTRRFRKSFKPG